MIIAIPSTDNNENALADDRFGRCEWFCIYNTENKNIEFLKNQFAKEAGGVGPQVAEFLGNNNVQKVYSFEIGPKAKKVIDALGIEVEILKKALQISEILSNQ